MNRTRHLVLSAWLGFALAGLFFYPLAAALYGDPFYLQWQPRDAVEVLVAVLVLTPTFGAAIFLLWKREGRGGILGLLITVLLPVVSLGAGLSRELPAGGAALKSAWEHPAVRFGAPAAAAVLLLAAVCAAPAMFGRWLRRLVVFLSPMSLVIVGSIAITAAHAGPLLAVSRAAAPPPTSPTCTPTLALLFDELSFTYLYDGSRVSAEYPLFRQFAEGATNYLAVTSPGPETLVSVPGFLAVRRFDAIRVDDGHLDSVLDGTVARYSASEPDSLFSTARRMGLSPEVAGYYLPYCDLLGGLVDQCRSFSFYNVSTADQRFSPWHAVQTTLILWPRQFPLGLLKNPPFASFQNRLVEESLAFALRPIDPARPVFRLVHFSIPHMPFVYGAGGYNPSRDPLRQVPDDQYVSQIHYVDRLFGLVVGRLRDEGVFDRTTVVVFTDHGFRGGGRERDVRHIPFIVKEAGQRARADKTDGEPGELLLRRVVEASCKEVPE